MQKRTKFFYIFLILFLLSLFIFFLSTGGLFKGNLITSIFSPVQREIHKTFISFTTFTLDSDKERLKKDNSELLKMLVDQKKLKDQNKALLDQFQIAYPKSLNLIPASVIGAPGFIPGVSVPEKLTLDKGESSGVKKGDTVIINNNLIGRIEKTSNSSSSTLFTSDSSSIFAVKVGIDKNILGTIK
ncbi:MAG TPA: rod shape-determining protein MreC, partial [Patescibacteria group bacterium]|nr:rod shape-determining protein MreC [Patescibacteria group bacterium]